MKPGEIEIISKHSFSTVEDMLTAIGEIGANTGQELYLINVYGAYYASNNATLERECLTDGSIVYNLRLGEDHN